MHGALLPRPRRVDAISLRVYVRAASLTSAGCGARQRHAAQATTDELESKKPYAATLFLEEGEGGRTTTTRNERSGEGLASASTWSGCHGEARKGCKEECTATA